MSDEDDYMSDAFLKQCGDTRPGLVSKQVAKTYKQESHQRAANQKSKTKPKSELEKERRDEGLGAALSSDNKGFSMLQKMGYKPGMALGKSGIGRQEPVPVELKTGRGGLGRESELKRRKNIQSQMLSAMSMKRQRMETKRKQHFLQRMNEKLAVKNVERDFYQSQKVCEQLDSQIGIQKPEEAFFWPEALLPQSSSHEDTEDRLEQLDPGYSNYVQDDAGEEDDDGEPGEEDDDLNGLTIEDRMEVLTLYLRNRHKYCVWCGTKYDDREDLQKNCPGDTAEAHDD